MDAVLLLPALVATIVSLVKAYFEKRQDEERRKRVDAAEERAFATGPDAIQGRLESLRDTQLNLEERARTVESLIDANKQAIALGSLFNLYNRQIERYQEETRARASWSFYIALLAMSCGFGFIFWGGQHVLADPRWDHIAAGSLLAAIGGGVSAFITKTFLEVHQLSLRQLNRYFDQPVINDHILMAQRLADALPDPTARQSAYQQVVAAVTNLIKHNSMAPQDESHRRSADSKDV